MTRRLLSALLRAWGYEVLEAGTLHDGLNQVQRARFVLLDLMLPDGNGMDVLQRIRDRGLGARVAVITAESGAAQREASRLGAALVLEKPINLNDLLRWLKQE
jgi:DNA-binding response OmpR family regulator